MFHILTTLGSFFNKVHYYCMLENKGDDFTGI